MDKNVRNRFLKQNHFELKKSGLYLLYIAIGLNTMQSQPSDKVIYSLHIVLTSAKEDTGKVKTLNELTGSYRSKCGADQARSLVHQSIQLAHQLNFKSGKASAYNLCGLLEMDAGNEALAHYNDCLAIMEGINNKDGMAMTFDQLGFQMPQGLSVEREGTIDQTIQIAR